MHIHPRTHTPPAHHQHHQHHQHHHARGRHAHAASRPHECVVRAWVLQQPANRQPLQAPPWRRHTTPPAAKPPARPPPAMITTMTAQAHYSATHSNQQRVRGSGVEAATTSHARMLSCRDQPRLALPPQQQPTHRHRGHHRVATAIVKAAPLFNAAPTAMERQAYLLSDHQKTSKKKKLRNPSTADN